ncbi:hypothetical protein HMPREF9413_2099 [Paenibacillus sp. HGF7]|nr:hypothetical protein HMPREF9413_2099 [Paenibacillus sp. HGF7]
MGKARTGSGKSSHLRVSQRRVRAFLHVPHEPVSRPVRTVLPGL